jgi:hypothetical protein
MLKRAQAMIESALVLPLALFFVAASVDILWNLGNRNLAVMATAYAAQQAADGRQDAEVRQAAVELSQRVLQPQDVRVTPCWARQAEGLPVEVETWWQPRAIAPMTVHFWSRAWGAGATQRVALSATRGCRWDLL